MVLKINIIIYLCVVLKIESLFAGVRNVLNWSYLAKVLLSGLLRWALLVCYIYEVKFRLRINGMILLLVLIVLRIVLRRRGAHISLFIWRRSWRLLDQVNHGNWMWRHRVMVGYIVWGKVSRELHKFHTLIGQGMPLDYFFWNKCRFLYV